MKILVLNAGSSSQKCALFELGCEAPDDPVEPLWQGKLAWNGEQQILAVHDASGKQVRKQANIVDRRASLKNLLQNLWDGPAATLRSTEEISGVGHRIVHGGSKLIEPVVLNERAKQAIADVSSIAPLHNRAGLDGIDLVEQLLPGKPQIAVFDTAFHQTLPLKAKVYSGPYEWYERGIRRFGFHGINHQYCAQRAAKLLHRDVASLKVVICHLGNGCSLAAVERGKSVDTSMGFTPLEGLMMGTRSGSVDPGILLHLQRKDHATTDELDEALNHESGLLGISGVSADMREVLAAAAKGHERAKLAVDIFIHRLQKEIGAMAASLGGLDVLIFTAGIGENAATVRQLTCERLGFLGIELDESLNSSAHPEVEISKYKSTVKVLIIRAQEDWAIARECVRLL